MDYVKGMMFGNKSKGTAVNKAINSWGRKLQADWMVSEAYSPFEEDEEEEYDDDGNLIEKLKKMNLQKLRSIGYIKEAISWNEDDNFDRVSAMSMVMILRENRLKFEIQRTEQRINNIHNDPWFNRSFKGNLPAKHQMGPLRAGIKDGYALIKRESKDVGL